MRNFRPGRNILTPTPEICSHRSPDGFFQVFDEISSRLDDVFSVMGHGYKGVSAIADKVNDPWFSYTQRQYPGWDLMRFYNGETQLLSQFLQLPFFSGREGVKLFQPLIFSEILLCFIINLNIIPGINTEYIQQDIPQECIP